MTYRLSQTVAPAFYGVHAAIRRGDCNEAILYGGRGSAKSSFASVELILQLLRHRDCHAVVLRKRENRLRSSVYSQLQWAISQLGLGSKFRCTVSPMEIQYLPSGQKILFFGMDDPDKIKSIKAPFGYFGLLWFEELDQFGGPEEVRSVEQSVLRGGDWTLVLKTFNPPRNPAHWANRELLIPKEGRLCCQSSYLQLPESWLGSRFLEDAAALRERDPEAYEHEYMGAANGCGGQVFSNLKLRPIAPEERKGLSDRLYRGVDWGWYPDPFVFEELAYVPGERRLYLLREFSGFRLSNASIEERLREMGMDGSCRICCDSGGEGQKSASELRSRGLDLRCARKGPGSVERGLKWLAGLREIVIDPQSCPLAAKEFSQYQFQRDKEGNWLSGFPDKDNHSIDAVRYALESLWR